MSDRASDPDRDGQRYQAAGLPRGLRSNPGTASLPAWCAG
jgi:hypothetical protein